MTRHFLTLSDLQPAELLTLIDRAIELKAMWRSDRECPQIMRNRSIALVFQQSSTRTRISFEVAAHHMGGNAIFLAPGDSQLKRGESDADTARVLSSMVDLIVTRTGTHNTAETYASHSKVPVINGLSNAYHPCQLLADLQTIKEIKGSIQGNTVAWIGDGNNMCISWVIAASMLGIKLRVSTPSQYAPHPDLMKNCNFDYVELHSNPIDAIQGADVVVTDTWLSMNQEEEEKQARMIAFEPYQVSQTVMNQAGADAIFMHCLPAYRGMEVQAEVIDGPQSVVWQEAENRLHVQKALMELLLASQ